MNPYECNAIDFLAKIDYLAKRKDLKTKDSLFKVLVHIQLREGFHLGLKVAGKVGLGNESCFYSYYGKEDPIMSGYPFSTHNHGLDDILFAGLDVEMSEMGAWQAYLLWMSPTVLPVFWHGGYICREYFFDRENFKGIIPTYGEMPVEVTLDQIPHPNVTIEGNKAIVTCPYWNEWEGLVLESMPIIFKGDGEIAFRRAKHKVLYKYNCGICY